MDSRERGRRIVRFGDYEVDRDARELRHAGRRVPLQIQPFAVLEILVERAGQVVTREHLRAKIWPSTIYVDFDHGLNNAILRLRRALRDSAETPRYLETLPRVGYRFICPVEQGEVARTQAAWLQRARGVRWAVAAAAAAVGVVALGVGTFHREAPVMNGVSAYASIEASPEARDAYRRGVQLFEQRRKESNELSIKYLRRAIELDPDFAAAHAALAMAYTLAGGTTLVRYRSPREVLGPALAAAQRALQLDSSLPQAHVALANVLNQLMPWSAANDVVIESAYLRALELEPTNASAHLFLGNFLSTRGRSGEAIDHFRLAVESNPLSPSANSRLGMELVAAGDVQAGVEYLQNTVELDPWQFNAQVRLGWGWLALADLDAAERAFQTAERISPQSVQSRAGLAVVAARRGDSAAARTLLQTLLPLADAAENPFEVAMIYVALKDTDLSIEWLKRTAQTSRVLSMAGQWGIRSSVYDWLRGDPRFAELEREIVAQGRPSPGARTGSPSRSN